MYGHFHVRPAYQKIVQIIRGKSLPWSQIVLIATSLDKAVSKQLLRFSANVNKKEVFYLYIATLFKSRH